MPEMAMDGAASARAPWHLWVVGMLSLLWNASGAYVIMAAQNGAALDMDATEIAYYAAQEPWFVALADLALIAALLGAVALLLRSRWAIPLYGLSIAAIAITTTYDAVQETALFLQSQDWLIQLCVTACLAIAQLAYALAMRGRGVLR